MKNKKNKNVIEVKFNSDKERVFIFLRSNVTLKLYEHLLNLFEARQNNKIYLLPSDYVESVKVIKDIKDKKLQKWMKYLKKDLAKSCKMKVKELFGKENPL